MPGRKHSIKLHTYLENLTNSCLTYTQRPVPWLDHNMVAYHNADRNVKPGEDCAKERVELYCLGSLLMGLRKQTAVVSIP